MQSHTQFVWSAFEVKHFCLLFLLSLAGPPSCSPNTPFADYDCVDPHQISELSKIMAKNGIFLNFFRKAYRHLSFPKLIKTVQILMHIS